MRTVWRAVTTPKSSWQFSRHKQRKSVECKSEKKVGAKNTNKVLKKKPEKWHALSRLDFSLGKNGSRALANIAAVSFSFCLLCR